MVASVPITHSVVALKVPLTSEVDIGALALNLADCSLYSKRYDGSVIRIEGDTGNDTIASASSIALGAVMAGVVEVTGSATINTIVLREGQTRTVRFAGALTLTNGSSLVLPGAVNIATAAGDFATFRGYAGGVVRCIGYSAFAGLSATSTVVTDDTTTNATVYPTWVTGTTGSLPQKTTSSRLTFNPLTGLLTAPSFSGQLNGAVGLITPATAMFTSASASGQITSTVATGTAPFVISSTTNVANLNASSLSGATFAEPGAIGGTTRGSALFTTIGATGAVSFGTTAANPAVTLGGAPTVDGSGFLKFSVSNAAINWALDINSATGGGFSIMASSASGGFTYNDRVIAIRTTGMTVAKAFGCNGKTAQTAYASGGALNAYVGGTNGFDSGANASALHAMVVSIRAALLANGIMS